MDLYNLGKVPWQQSQLIYHALAHLGRESLSLVSPARPYVCIGYHQDADQEVDLEFCKARGIPVFRRDLGGGAVYLDGNQLFFQLILHRDNPEVPKRKEFFYRKFLEPVIRVYRTLGIEAVYKPINDVIVEARKISGTGAGEIGECVVFVGNLIVDFDYDMMCRVLKVPDEKFRDKVKKTLRENLSTIRRELGEEQASKWDEAALNAMMAEEFGALLGPMRSREKDAELEAKMEELGSEMLPETWTVQKSRRHRPGRDVKLRSGANLIHRVHKAVGGLIRADFENLEGRFGRVHLSGDFFCYPESAIEAMAKELEGTPANRLKETLQRFYEKSGVETPGIGMEDWIRVLS